MLLFPAALAISIILFVWFIGPEFSVIKDKTSELNSEEKSLQEIMDTKQNLNSLEANLIGNADREGIVLDYLPSVRKEEEIINTLDYLATSSGISLLNLAVTCAKTANVSSVSIAASQAGNSEEALKAKMAAKKIEAKLNLVGSYEGIKSFLGQVYKVEKANNICFASISRQPESDSLLTEVNIDFSYLPQIRLSADDGLADPVFSQKEFNFAVVDDLMNLISGKIPEIEVGSAGKANPFLP